MTLSDLRRSAREPARLDTLPEPEILSIEGALYIVRIGDEMLTTRPGGEPLRFRSAWAAGRALGEAGLRRGWLVHESAYDEMLGRADEGQPPPAPLRTSMRFPGAER